VTQHITALVNGTIYTRSEVIPNGILLIDGTAISAVGTADKITVPPGARKIDIKERLICPGFIDIHVHGGGGSDTMDASYEALNQITKTHVRFGTTALCPTTMAATDNDICRALSSIATAVKHGTIGARVIGAHIEGPFINPKKHGAHVEEFITPPSIERLQRFIAAAQNQISILTIAPEMPNALDVIRYARSSGIVCSIGHTNATYIQARAGFVAGATSVTHIYNAMAPLTHREPGVVGATLTSDEVIAEVIADGKHVHPSAIQVVVRAKGESNILLVTDGMRPIGVGGVTSFILSGRTVNIYDGACYTVNGVLAGSILTMNIAVKNMNHLVGVPLHQAIQMASLVPAHVLGIDEHKGSLEPGKDADVIICDHEMNIEQAFVEGQLAYQMQ